MAEIIKIFLNTSTNLGSFIAGLLVFIIGSLIVFFIKDILKKPPSFTGVFYLKTTTLNSSYKPYIGLSSCFMLTLLNESPTKIIGKAEKIYDIESDGHRRNYTGKHRNYGDVLITIERLHVRRNKLNIHINLHGDHERAQRPTSLIATFNTAEIITNGSFITTAADASGTAHLTNKKPN
nr:hypothetical protein [Providencia alcalifaciens]